MNLFACIAIDGNTYCKYRVSGCCQVVVAAASAGFRTFDWHEPEKAGPTPTAHLQPGGSTRLASTEPHRSCTTECDFLQQMDEVTYVFVCSSFCLAAPVSSGDKGHPNGCATIQRPSWSHGHSDASKLLLSQSTCVGSIT